MESDPWANDERAYAMVVSRLGNSEGGEGSHLSFVSEGKLHLGSHDRLSARLGRAEPVRK